ncbi:radical SAM/SPASM domain-containing protein [Cellulosilyticum ruminicola]|uniref:radical SAM/SPASM domain-containing protein n=1 Tax=Cellulosilyticum ruminicola TaxID=425254 RepID=UPI0006D1DEA2|nr:radical SAM protein [Cellulosilyticum ruminicola]
MVEKALRFIYYDYMPQYKKYRIDFVSGGEPLLNFDVIKYVKQVGDKLYKETNKPLELWVATNGTLLTDETVKYLDENNINIGISLDGDKMQHDLLRVDINGKGTYERVVNNIKKIKASKVYSRHTKDIWGLVVITSKTKSLVDILRHHYGLGFRNVQMKIVRLEKESEYAINSECVEQVKEMYTELFDFFTAQLEDQSITYLKMILNDNDFAGKIVRRLLLRYVVQNRCQAGKNKVSIAANGDIYPCDSFVGMEKYKIGNIFEQEMHNEFEAITIETRQECSKCWAKYICGGDCYHNSCLVNHSIYKPDSIICELEKFVIKKALVYIDTLGEKAPDQYKYLMELLAKREKMLL